MKSKTKADNQPWAPARPYLLKNLQQQDDVFTASQPDLMKYAGQQRDTYGRVAPGAEAGIVGAQSLVNRNIAGGNMGGNPYLDAILGRTRENVIGGVNDQFGSAGRFGSGAHQSILARELADAETRARFQNYGIERQYQQDAIAQAQQLMGGSQSLIESAASLPWQGVQAANGAVRQASAGYGTQTGSTTHALGPLLAQAVGNAAAAYTGRPR